MNHGIMSKRQCNDICQKFCELNEYPFSGNLDEFLDTVNQQIHPFHFKVKQAKREDNGETVYVLVSLAENDLNKLIIGGDFTKQELDLFKKILELIVYNNRGDQIGETSSIDVLNLADTISPKISKIEVKKILDRFVDEQWFYRNRGMVTLSPRAILELEVYISDVFKDFIQICEVCNRIVFYGRSCLHCYSRLHIFCAERYYANKVNPKCLSCKQSWNNNVESNVEVCDDESGSTSDSSNTSNKYTKRRCAISHS